MRLLDKIVKHHTTNSTGEISYIDFDVLNEPEITDNEYKQSEIVAVPKSLIFKTQKSTIYSEKIGNEESYERLGLDIKSLKEAQMMESMDSFIEDNVYHLMNVLGHGNSRINQSINKPIRKGFKGFIKNLLSRLFSIKWKDEFICDLNDLFNRIMRVSRQGHLITRMSIYDTVIVNSMIASRLCEHESFKSDREYSLLDKVGIWKIGTLAGIDVFVNPFQDFNDYNIVYASLNPGNHVRGIYYIFKNREFAEDNLIENSTLIFPPGSSVYFYSEILPIHKSFI